MTEPTIERVIRNLDQRLGEVLQILPTLATKDQVREEVRNLATKEELRGLATKDDLLGLATKDDFAALATKADVRFLEAKRDLLCLAIREDSKALATSEDLAAFRDTLIRDIREEGARSRRHMDIVAEDIKSQFRLVTESHLMLDARERLHHEGTAERLDAVEADVAVLKLARPGADRA